MRKNRIFSLAIASMTALLSMSFTSCGSDDTPVTAIKLSVSTIKNAKIGDVETLTATITPDEDATNPNVVWTHVNDGAIEITANGYTATVKILKQENDTIICSAAENNGVMASCFVTFETDDDTEGDTDTSDDEPSDTTYVVPTDTIE